LDKIGFYLFAFIFGAFAPLVIESMSH